MLVRAVNLSKRYPIGRRRLWQPPRVVHAVDGVDLAIEHGRTLALVGESGSGKTTLGELVAGLSAPSEGSIEFDGIDLVGASSETRRRLRRQLQVIFQDPYSSLNPRHTIRMILARPFQVHTSLTQREIEREIADLLALVGLGPFEAIVDRHPHQFSGGQRQRIAFARAIALRPRFIVADEPVSSLDMSVKAQLLTLLRRFQSELDLTYLFITHELSVVRTVAHDVAVMYLGRVVELAPAVDVFERPLHPYTVALLASTPILDPVRARARSRAPLHGSMPSPVDPPSGCHFHTRCAFARPVCVTTKPQLRQIGDRRVACHFVGQPDFPGTANVAAELRDAATRHSEPYESNGLALAVPDARVEDGIAEIGDQVGDDHHD
jgi:oligopeptide/dipeptide ABC transporter ATP-binding protein